MQIGIDSFAMYNNYSSGEPAGPVILFEQALADDGHHRELPHNPGRNLFYRLRPEAGYQAS